MTMKTQFMSAAELANRPGDVGVLYILDVWPHTTYIWTGTAMQAMGAFDTGSGYAIQAPDGGLLALSNLHPESATVPTGTATTTVLTGAGEYSHYRCTTATGNITVYDSLTASGKVLVPTTALALGTFPIFGAGHSGVLAVTTGVTVVLSGAGVVYIGASA